MIKKCGGKVDIEKRIIAWSLPDAKRYASYILLYEIGHIIYGENYVGSEFHDTFSNKEEEWSNNFTMQLIKEMRSLHHDEER